jgi:arylsulfatase B
MDGTMALARCCTVSWIALVACGTSPTAPDPDDTVLDEIQVPKVLLVVLDDLGVDQVNTYLGALDLPEDAPATPHLQALADEGLTFLHAWGSPTCSAMRAALLTGRHAFRTGVGTALGPREEGLPADELTFAEHLGDPVDTALIGKWHLGHTAATGGDETPNAQGFDHYAGLLAGEPEDYFAWNLVEDGVDQGLQTTYATSWVVDHALSWMQARDQEQPWLLEVAFNLVHTPLHAPPDDLHTGTLPVAAGEACAEDAVACFDAMVEAADHELGRLLDGTGDDVTVIVVGDNGTSRTFIDAPFSRRHAKGTVYEGGVRVPLIVAGAGVARIGAVETGLVQTLDLFSTVIELLGGTPPDDVDARSLVPLLRDEAGATAREVLYTEQFTGGDPTTSDLALRDAGHLVVRRAEGAGTECYDLIADPDTERDLVDGASTPGRCAELEALMDAVRE